MAELKVRNFGKMLETVKILILVYREKRFLF